MTAEFCERKYFLTFLNGKEDLLRILAIDINTLHNMGERSGSTLNIANTVEDS